MRGWGQQVPQNGCCVEKGPASVSPESCFGHTQQTAVPRAESGVRLVPLRQTTEILRSEAVRGFVREDQDLVVHTGKHSEPVQLPAQRCHMRELGRERQDSGGTVQDPLQLVGEKLADSAEESVAAVDARCCEGVDQSLRRLLGEHTADTTDVAQVDIRAIRQILLTWTRVFRCLSKHNVQVAYCSTKLFRSQEDRAAKQARVPKVHTEAVLVYLLVVASRSTVLRDLLLSCFDFEMHCHVVRDAGICATHKRRSIPRPESSLSPA